MSYHGLGLPNVSPTTLFAEAVDPYAMRAGPPGGVYSPYGWGPDFNYGMPMNYTHHIDYVREPVPGARPIGPMYDQLGSYDSSLPPGRPGYYPNWPPLPMTWKGGAPNYGFAPYMPRQRVVLGPLEGLGQPPYYPRWPRVPMTWKGDVNYAMAPRRSGLSGVLAVV